MTEPMGVAKVYIFSRPNEPAVSGVGVLKGKTIGTRWGMPYGKSFDNANLEIEATSSIVTNINKLMNHRLHYMVAYVPDAYDAFESLGLEPFPHQVDVPLAVHADALVCKGNTKALVETFNNVIRSQN